MIEGDPWREIKSRERLVIFCFVGFMPFAGGVAILVSHFTSSEWAILAAPAAWMVFLMVSWIRFLNCPCPKCGQPFHVTHWISSLPTRGRKCIHCGVSRYE